MRPFVLAGMAVLTTLLLCSVALAGPMPESEVPAPLKPWIGWVLHGHDARLCPQPAADGEAPPCVWPTQLSLDVDAHGGRFALDVHNDAPAWIDLPGGDAAWPQTVTADARAEAVVAHDGVPSLHLAAGSHHIEGRFDWPRLPATLHVPAAAGLVSLTVDGKAHTAPARDADSRIALGRATATEVAASDTLQLRVFRLLDDRIPMRLTTQLEIAVAGKPREVQLGPLLPTGFKPLGIDSPLAAHIDDDGRLRLQVRPGVWTLDITARAAAPVAAVSMPAAAPPWPERETWSFQARPDLRQVEIEGAPAVDPQQVQVPAAWRNLPAYAMTAAATLKLAEKQRGQPQPEPDHLDLERNLWLDFDGGGYTAQDHLHGRLNGGWRLQTQAPLTLGRVVVDGEPQLITRNSDGQGTGVEVRRSQLDLTADSRIDTAARRLPVGGWNKEIQNVDITLHLPPAWRLLGAPGSDNVPDTWLSRWTLLDLFVVLVAGIAALRLLGAVTGALTLVTLALVWHEPEAPRWCWINLIAALAILRALPDSARGGALERWLQRYRWASTAAVLLIAIPFALTHVRRALYPQLEVPQAVAGVDQLMLARPEGFETAEMKAKAAPTSAPPPPAAMASAAPRVFRSMATNAAASPEPRGGSAAQQPIQRLDPNARVQTGPGLPQWRWRSVRLHWNGPVTPEQSFRLWLQPPWATRLLDVLSIVLVAVLLARLADLPRLRGPGLMRELKQAVAPGAVLLVALTAALGYAPRAHAQDGAGTAPVVPPSPGSQLLDELRQRLLAPPDCAPACAQIPRLQLKLGGDGILEIRLTVEAQAATAVALPVPRLAADDETRSWQPTQVLLDGRPAELRRSDAGELHAEVGSGRHELLLRGSVQGLSQVQLPLPLKPHAVSAALDGWQLSGVDDDGQPGDALQLIEQAAAAGSAATAASAQSLPPLLGITRTFHLGLDWRVDTLVRRYGSTATALVAPVPLLPGEAVTAAGVRVVDRNALASFAPGESVVQWSSRLPVAPQLQLVAPSGGDSFETWRFDIAPIWHAAPSGLPPVQRIDGGVSLPAYEPWPGESLKLQISRPAGAAGQTLTLQQARLAMQPGTRTTEYQLDLQIESSQGGQHRLALPQGFDPIGLTIDGASQPLRRDRNAVVLPLHPGSQSVALKLRQNEGLHSRLTTPAFDLGIPGANARLDVNLSDDRWVLFAGGPRLGPAVLFWGVLVVYFALAAALGRSRQTPLRGIHWALLFVGLSQISVAAAAVVVAWLFALALRGRIGPNLSRWRFNALQLALILLTAAALALLFSAVAQGLLGRPDMQIAGNGSHATSLHWYQDRFGPALPRAWVWSVSIWVYRLLMLLWALWLANALLGWLRWGWDRFASGGLWQRRPATVDA